MNSIKYFIFIFLVLIIILLAYLIINKTNLIVNYKGKKDSKIVLQFLKNGWDTKIKDFLFYSKNT